MLKEQKIRDKKHLRFISGLPCLTCGVQGMTQAAHIRSGNQSGMALKSGDDCTVPLCIRCHEIQHRGERKFWSDKGGIERATTLAKCLYKASGDEAEAHYLLARWG